MGCGWSREILRKGGKSSEKERAPTNDNDSFIVLATRCSGRFTPGSDNWGRSNIAKCSQVCVSVCTTTHMLTPTPAEPQSGLSTGSLTMQRHFCFPARTPPQVHPVSHKRLWSSFFEKCTGSEGSSPRGAHMEPILSSLYPWPKAGMMNGSCQWCIVSLAAWELCLPGPGQLAMCWALSTPGCNWNKLAARWRNLGDLLLMIYFRVKSLVCLLKVVWKWLPICCIGSYKWQLDILALIPKKAWDNCSKGHFRVPRGILYHWSLPLRKSGNWGTCRELREKSPPPPGSQKVTEHQI